MVQSGQLDVDIASGSVSVVSVWETPSSPPPRALASFTSWASRTAQSYFLTQLVAALAEAPWPSALDTVSRAELSGAIVGGIAKTWEAYTHHSQRTGSIIDTWTFDPTLISELAHDLHAVLRAVLPADLGEQTKDALYGGLVVALAESLWRRLSSRTSHSPAKVAPPPRDVLHHGKVYLHLPGQQRRSFTASKTRSRGAKLTRRRRRKRHGA
jgi:hypothetical protein